MPWNPDNDAVEGQIDSSIKDSPPNPSMINTAATVRAALKAMWSVMRTQVQAAVTSFDAVQNTFVTRSLSLFSTIFVDGVNGNDARTGTTNDNNAATGCVKTLTRVAQLHNDKTKCLLIHIVGNLDINTEQSLYITELHFLIAANVIVTVKKKTIYDPGGIAIGEGPYITKLYCTQINMQVYLGGSLIIEAHSGSSGLGNQAYYTTYQGAFMLGQQKTLMPADMFQTFTLVVNHQSTFTLGANQTFVTPGTDGYYNVSWNNLARYKRILSGTTNVTIAASATESLCFGERLFPRAYTPTSSTDAKVMDGELCADATYLYRKSGSTIKKIAWTAF